MSVNTSKPKVLPPIITIVSSPGAGKTTLAALFPSPVFIQAEPITAVFDPWNEDQKPDVFDELPRASEAKKISTKEVLLAQLRSLIKEEHDYKTLVIDSLTGLHLLFEHEVCENYGVDNVANAAGGFHKGYLVVADMHNEIINACKVLRNKGMTIIFISHSCIKKIRNRPDVEEHTIYSLDMHDASVGAYVNVSDVVTYIRSEEFVKGTETNTKGQVTKYGKVIQTGQRVLVTSGDGRMGYINAKNRYDLDPEIPFIKGENPLVEQIGYYKKCQ